MMYTMILTINHNTILLNNWTMDCFTQKILVQVILDVHDAYFVKLHYLDNSIS